MKQNRFLCTVSIFAAGVLWGLMGWYRRKLGEIGLDSFGMIFIRCGFAAALFFLSILLTNPAALRVKWKNFWCFFGSGICSLMCFSACYFQAMQLMSLSAAAILLYTAPCFVMIISSFLFQEKMTKRKVLSLILAFAGCCLVSGIIGSDTKLTLTGILYGFGSGFGYALYTVFGKLAMRRGYGSLTVSFWSCLLAATGAGIIWGVREPLAAITASPETLLTGAAAGIVTCYLPYLLYTFGLTQVEAGRASVIASVEPVVATLVGFAAFGEAVSIPAGIGIVLVLLAIVLISEKVTGGKMTCQSSDEMVK